MPSPLGVLHLGTLAADAGGSWMSYFPFVIVFLIFYLVVFRPGSKEKKAREAAIKALKKHDRVITNAGIHGVVVALEGNDTVVLRVDDKANVRIRFSRAAIWQVNPETPVASETAPTPADEPAGTSR